jgi:hypothetical protein
VVAAARGGVQELAPRNYDAWFRAEEFRGDAAVKDMTTETPRIEGGAQLRGT